MISGKSFADRCDWVFDPRYPEKPLFDYRKTRNGDWVFINGDYILQFASRIPLQFGSGNKFCIIVHNSDLPFGMQEFRILAPHSLHIYAINTTIEDPILTTIPIGFVDKHLPLLHEFKGGSSERPYEVYANFSLNTNLGKRKECMDTFRDDPRLVYRTGLSVPEYFMDLCRSRFVLCPEGTGIDTHRVYESILCGATPVVLRNSLSHLYEKLPVCIVEKWTDTFIVPDKPVRLDVRHFLSS